MENSLSRVLHVPLVTHKCLVNKCFEFLYLILSYLSRARDGQSSKEREVGSLRRQLDNTSEELTEVGRGREVALRENRRLQDDLATMTRENQVG